MDILDRLILVFVNQFAQKSWLLDKLMNFLAGNSLFKGGVLVSLYWYCWYQDEARQVTIRRCIVATFIAAMLGIVSARGMALLLPLRLRPMHNPELHFVMPFGTAATDSAPEDLDGWSSFPSDHAVLFVSLAVGFVYISRRVGYIALLYTLIIIVFPRLYLGLHYFSDLLFGSIWGAGLTVLANVAATRSPGVIRLIDAVQTRPSIFYPIAFLISYQIADMFFSMRGLVHAAFVLLSGA